MFQVITVPTGRIRLVPVHVAPSTLPLVWDGKMNVWIVLVACTVSLRDSQNHLAIVVMDTIVVVVLKPLNLLMTKQVSDSDASLYDSSFSKGKGTYK